MRYWPQVHAVNSVKKHLLIIAGWLSLVIGIIGAFLPLIPTVPLVLLSAACFARSSPRFHAWLINHPKFGPIIEQYKQGQGIPKSVKIRIIVLMALSMGLSAYLVNRFWASVGLAVIGLGVGWYIWSRPSPK